MTTVENVANLFAELLKVDRTTQSIDNGVLTITQNGRSISLPINSSSIVRQTLSRF
jgi:hypothetical protein